MVLVCLGMNSSTGPRAGGGSHQRTVHQIEDWPEPAVPIPLLKNMAVRKRYGKGREGLEPPTTPFREGRSIQLSYRHT
jgi:hypothetical protein